jgi:hypothetical protein
VQVPLPRLPRLAIIAAVLVWVTLVVLLAALGQPNSFVERLTATVFSTGATLALALAGIPAAAEAWRRHQWKRCRPEVRGK